MVLARQVGVPIALDESVGSIGEACTALAIGAMGMLNVKPARVGGPIAAVAVAQVAAEEGRPVFCGGMFESGIGRAAALAFAGDTLCTGPTDLGPSSRYVLDDLTAPFSLEDGSCAYPTVPASASLPTSRCSSGAPSSAGRGERLGRPHRADHGRRVACTRPIPDPAAREFWFFEPSDRAVVLGSTQGVSLLNLAEVDRLGLDVVRRRSGGGAVLVEPDGATWFDVVLPAGDPRWHDDVAAAATWVGRCCAEAFRDLGVDADDPVTLPTRTRWSPLVCFAGLGVGEVTVGGAKAVGISNGGPAAARFQVSILHRWDPDVIAGLLALTPGEQVELAGELVEAASPLACDPAELRSSLVGAISRE